MRAVVTGSRCPHRYGAIVRRGEEKTIQQHRNSVAELRSGEAMWGDDTLHVCRIFRGLKKTVEAPYTKVNYRAHTSRGTIQL